MINRTSKEDIDERMCVLIYFLVSFKKKKEEEYKQKTIIKT